MPRRQQPVSETELDVLKILWEKSEGTVREIMDALAPQRQWAYTTVQTLLNRLEAKGYVKCRRGGFAHVYRPLVSREQLLQRELSDLSRRLCEGTASPLFVALVEGVKLTPEEIDELRQWLDELAAADESSGQAESRKGTR